MTARSVASYIARGCGRSYGDASLNAGAAVVSQLRLNRMLSFDAATGILECEAGTTFRDIVGTFLPRGFFPAVTPGTQHVTVGGAIAADVHGKNHLRAGTFGALVNQFNLLLADGSSITCSPEENPDVFHATVGGMGLTGFITRVRLRMMKVASPMMRVQTRRVANLEESLEQLERIASTCEHAVAWADPLAGGSSFGRGVVFGADHPGNALAPSRASRITRVPADAPSWTLNRLSLRAFNELYYRRHTDGQALQHITDFLYPLDSVENWNRLYGRRGFIQYQCVIPREAGQRVTAELLRAAATSGHDSFLVTIKRFGRAGRGLLSFPIEGLTIAMDIPVRDGLAALAPRLDSIVADAGGRVYLGKDALLTKEMFNRMYARADEFRMMKRRLDPNGLISSSMARRLGLIHG